MEAHVGHASPRRLPSAADLRRWSGHWPWLPLPLAGVYLITIATKFSGIVANTYLNGDAASAPVIGALFRGSSAHRQVILGQLGWYSTLLTELATRWLPAHRQIWEALPALLALASAVLVSWGALRLAGRWAAVIAGVIALCAGPTALSWLFSLNDHSPTWFCFALLGALLVLLFSPPAWLTRPWAALVVVVAGVILGVNAASDPLLIIAGLVPAALAAVAALWVTGSAQRRQALIAAGAALVTMVVFFVLTRAWAHHENIIASPGPPRNVFAAGDVVSNNFKLWWQSVMAIGDGDFFGAKVTLTSALELMCGLLGLLTLLLTPLIAWREGNGALTKRDPARVAWCVFWATSAILLSGVFIFSTSPVDQYSARYLIGAVYAAAALIPLLASTRPLARVLITAGAALYALTGVVCLISNQSTPTATLIGYPQYNQVAKLARENHLAFGYADYWDAAPITWATHLRLHVYPVQDCGAQLCPSSLHDITSWYVPRASTPTFLIADTARPTPSNPVPGLGTPTHVYQISAMTMYVYPYDIAARIQP
ncbi:MAG TPA: hypothetical protein VHX88_03705 [Solirubrobacteraceae bacterium]|nr:hypothetical protein [Solirubrobacteraceae bacterium]